MKLVSIIMAARNEEELIQESLVSLLNQTYPNVEIVVINDGSTDNTENIVKTLMKEHDNIKLINIEHTYDGINTAIPRLVGVENSSGEILFVVDADACYSSDYIEKCLEPLGDPQVAGSVGKIRVWDPSTWISKCRDVLYRVRWDDHDEIRSWIRDGRIALWVFKREVYDELGGYNKDIPYGEDRDLAQRALEKGYKIDYVPETTWYHKWEEEPLKVFKNQFNVGRQNYVFAKRLMRENVKKLYLISLPLLLVGALFYPPLIILAILHLSPLVAKGVELFVKAKNCKNRAYALLFPLYIYVFDFPVALGFAYQFLFGRLSKR
ncbi:MAG: glycosyltransferase [Methanocellales archaeon]|nr:glycosyltransferase [Methanocellales archaeon]